MPEDYIRPGVIVTEPPSTSEEVRLILRARYESRLCLQCGQDQEYHADECPNKVE